MTTPAADLDLALQHYGAGNLAAAEQVCRQLVQGDPQNAAAWHLLGLLAASGSRYEIARDCFRQAVHLQPDSVDGYNNLGNVLSELGNLEEAAASYRRALELHPGHVLVYANLGNVLHRQGKTAEAVACLQQAVQIRPQFAGAWTYLGHAYRDLGKLNLATSCFLRAGELAALAYRLDEAATAFEEGLPLDPGNAELHNRLGRVYWEQARVDQAVAHFEEALRRNPANAQAHYNLGVHYLVHGDYARGWAEYEWRWKAGEYEAPRHQERPLWNRERLDGKTILLYAEQGFGDTLQFIRYAALVKQQGGTVLVECQPDLVLLLQGCPGIDQLLPRGADLPAFDVQAPLMSLPYLCRTTSVAAIPANVPYLSVDEDRVRHWRQRLAAYPGRKVGICWQGNPAHVGVDARRSVPLQRFAPLAEVAGVQLVSLQRGAGSEQLSAYRGPGTILDICPSAKNRAEAWLDSAALVRALDLIVTICTSVAHLAGALGAPVWVTQRYVTDWRWLGDGEDSPWYPTVRLFRQKRLGDWDDVFVRLQRALRDWAQNCAQG